MKSLKEYITESEQWVDNPAVGDDFAINIKEDCLIESYIIGVEEDRLCIEADEKLVSLLEEHGYSLEETCSDCGHEACVCETNGMGAMEEDGLEGVPDTMGAIQEEPEEMDEAEYQGRKVPLGKPMRGDVKKFKVYVKDPKTGNVKKVNFGHGGTSAKRAGQKTMKIKKSNPARRKSFRARHHCENPGPRTKARYWSCRAW